MAYNEKAMGSQEAREGVIAVDVLGHAVHKLHHAVGRGPLR